MAQNYPEYGLAAGATSSTLSGIFSELGNSGLANQQNALQNAYNTAAYYQTAADPMTTYVASGSSVYGLTYSGGQFVMGAAQEIKKVAKKAFAALMDEITEWHGDILAV